MIQILTSPWWCQTSSFLPAWCKTVVHVVLICILLIINKVDLLFIRWLVFHVTLLRNACSCLLLMFLTGLAVVYAANNFPQLVARLFIFFVMSWWMKFLNFNVIEFMIIFYYDCCFLPYWRKPALFWGHKDSAFSKQCYTLFKNLATVLNLFF